MTSAAGLIFLVAAPSGAGKSSLVKALLERDRSLQLSVSTTTRAPRPGEQHGREYTFVGMEEFEQRRARGEFLESAEVHGNWYGTSRQWIEQRLALGADVLLEIDWQGAQQIKRHFPEAVGIFVLPPSVDALRARLIARRQDSPDVIERRLLAACGEMARAPEFDYVIINDRFEVALEQLMAVVTAARLRYPVQIARCADLFRTLGVGADPR